MKNSLKASDFMALASLAGLLLLSACGGPEPANEAPSGLQPVVQDIPAPAAAKLVPLPGLENSVPELTEKTTVLMHTGTGDVTIEVYPQAAPNAAQRFVELVQAGYYDNTPISRVVPGFVAQFGINWRDGQKEWQDNTFDDDPTLFSLERGTLCFAKAGPNTNSTQVFINYVENNRLADPQYNFTVFGKVVEGMDVVDQFIQVGDPSGGLNQYRLSTNGQAYLDTLPTQPSMIIKAEVQP